MYQPYVFIGHTLSKNRTTSACFGKSNYSDWRVIPRRFGAIVVEVKLKSRPRIGGLLPLVVFFAANLRGLKT